jgi:hypothetical protein
MTVQALAEEKGGTITIPSLSSALKKRGSARRRRPWLLSGGRCHHFVADPLDLHLWTGEEGVLAPNVEFDAVGHRKQD